MKYCYMYPVILLLAFVIGCEEGGLGDLKSSSERDSGSEMILAEGETNVVAADEPQVLGTVEVTEKGLLVAIILWEGEPNELTFKLRHTATDLIVEASGGTPVAVTADVTNDTISAGPEWELSIINSEGPDALVTYKAAFLKQ